MSDEITRPAASGGRLASRALDWFDERTGVRRLASKVLDEPIPGGARWAYVFGSGLLFILLNQVVTGVALALYYTPTAETAHTSVAYITKQVAGGAFLRSLHSYGSSAMIIVLALHFLQTFVYGSFRGRRELLWMSGALLSFLILGMGFTGYLLPWDQKAYFATTVGTNIAGQVPLIGNLMARILRGGDTIGTLTLSRFYVAHVFLIPASILLFVGAHILLFRKAGPAGPVTEDPVSPKLAREPFYPRQVLFDMGFVLLIIAVLSGLSYLRPVTLGPIANPTDTHFLPRPEWYYLPMFEWLKFWEGPAVVLGVVVIPGVVAGAMFLMPFIDRRLERKIWRRPIPALAVAIMVFGMVYLGAKSQMDDQEGPIAQQLAHQRDDEKAYSATPFEPYTNAPEPNLSGAMVAPAVDPLVSKGKGIFNERGCSACHGDNGTGTALAPSLVGITKKLPQDRLVALLHNPNARMKAGGMPTVDASPEEMTALLAYLDALGKSAANSSTAFISPSDVMGQGVGDEERAFAQSAISPSPRYGRRLGVKILPEGTIGRRLF
jgi:ubiquinol-cytochrome c reductase cytochrome b subunit